MADESAPADDPKAKAEERAARARIKADEGQQAAAEYQAEAERIAENTVRLRALRLEKEAADRLAAEAAPATPRKPAARKVKRVSA